MKVSKYTYLFLSDDNYYVYNTLSNALLEIDRTSYEALKHFQETRDTIPENAFDDEAFRILSENNFISTNDTDDFLRYKSIITRQRAQRDTMHLTVAPTMDCCFNCHYCFEQYKTKERMSPSVMDAIVKYVSAQRDLKLLRSLGSGESLY